jgi:ABC-type transport system substrate-binding protein
MARLAGTLAMGLLAVGALVHSDAGATVRGGDGLADGGTLQVGVLAFDYIDPALTPTPNSSRSQSTFAVSWGVADATCALLLRYPVGTPPSVRFDLVPEVAERLPVASRDGRTYTFTIRKGYRFSDSTPVTAANYKRAIERVLNPSMKAPAAEYLQEVAGVKAVGNRLIVRLTKKVPDFPARMTMPYLCPVPTDLPMDEPEGVGAPLPGSGPYYVAEFVRGKQLVLKRNIFYRGVRPHHVDQMMVQLDDGDAVTRKVDTDALDVDEVVALSALDELKTKYGVNKARLFSVPSGNIFYVYMNTTRPLFRHNVKLRQAVNFALDRAALLRVFGPPWTGSLSDEYIPLGSPGYVDGHVYPVAHPNLARALPLAQGHTRSGRAVLYTCSDILTSCLAHAQTIQRNLKAIGIEVRIEQFPFAVVETKVGTRGEPFDLAVRRFSVPWVDPYQYVDRQVDGRTIQDTANTNLSYFNSSRYNRMIDRAARLSGQARYEAYGKLAVDIARDGAPMATMFVRNNRFFVSSRVGCVRAGAHGVDLAGLCLK